MVPGHQKPRAVVTSVSFDDAMMTSETVALAVALTQSPDGTAAIGGNGGSFKGSVTSVVSGYVSGAGSCPGWSCHWGKWTGPHNNWGLVGLKKEKEKEKEHGRKKTAVKLTVYKLRSGYRGTICSVCAAD